ncbi:MAG TPA: hypothetical protein VHP56_02310 [Solirubrobacterales bacterium]|jgi:hypothetical protein|nr:hypothetical protein [Solirubrobacterales bacterium]
MNGTTRKIAAVAGAALALLGVWAAPAGAEDEFDKFAVESISASLTDRQAGAHADMTIGVTLTRKGNAPYANAQDIKIELPPGVIGNPQAVPRCTAEQLGSGPETSVCPFDSQVGISLVRTTQPFANVYTEPVYNMVPPTGTDIVARFGFIAAAYPTFVNLRIDPTDYSVVATAEGLPSITGLSEATTTIWGVPAADVHDEERITPEEALHGGTPPGGRSVSTPEKPFLSNPTDCSMDREVTVVARSYQLPDQPSTKSIAFPQISGCGRLNFEPSFTTQLANPEAAAPSGLDTELTIPQDEAPQSLSTSTLKSARVTLPEGFAINAAAADGLEACSAEQVGYGKNIEANCPGAAKIGSIEAEVPALADTLHGSVYQRTPEPGRLFGLWVVADEQGVHLKLPARIETNPLSGQLTTVFDGIEALGGLPQVPVASLKLNVFGGPRAPLSTPGCGTYLTDYSFVPWSGKPAVEGKATMQVTQGCNKGGFSPKLSAGSQNSAGGRFSPFSFTLTRTDGEASPQKIALHMPQGLLAKLGGVPLCTDAGAATGACPANSRIGSLTASSGVGGAPLWIPQPGKAPTAVYLAGPYEGAPYSVVSVVPAQAGPFDLGLVVNRAAINVDPETALATIVTDPLPQFLEGVPVAYRTIHVDVDRPNFTINPTSCAQKKITATVTATNGSVAEPSDGFQATGCAKLAYTPKLKLAFVGATKRSGNPAVKAVLTQKPGQANSRAVTVILPGSQFIDNSHINNPCTRVQFAAEACPPKSILGNVTAVSPLLDKPLEGKVYFRSNGGDRELPDLVADLRGQIHVTVVGFIDSVNGRVRTRFLSVPDAPVTKFKMNLFGGDRGLIENSQNLCKRKRHVELHFKAQNGRTLDTNPVIGIKCGKKG